MSTPAPERPAPAPDPDPGATDIVTAGAARLDIGALSLSEILQLQNRLSQAVKRRFERERALVFSDVAGSTAYFQRHGDEAGRRLIERHLELIRAALGRAGGRIVDTAGDGAFLCFDAVEPAAFAVIDIQRRNAALNTEQDREHRMRLRIGLHWGTVLTDGTFVTGDAVNFAARVAGAAQPGEIRASAEAFRAFPAKLRLRCRALPPATYKGVEGPREQWLLEWPERTNVPTRLRLEETGEERTLPAGAIVRFGRLRELDGKPANEVVLALPDPALTQKISRWHFEIERLEDGGLALRQCSSQTTTVNGRPVPKGEVALVSDGTVVRVGGVLTISFLADPGVAEARGPDRPSDETVA